MSTKDQSKIIHDINSAISSITQAVDLISENWKDNPELVEKMLPLTQNKLTELQEDWLVLKNNFIKK
jgi:methyl-accepting chemotaxis protein